MDALENPGYYEVLGSEKKAKMLSDLCTDFSLHSLLDVSINLGTELNMTPSQIGKECIVVFTYTFSILLAKVLLPSK